ncbi:fimbrial protein [Serratia sp. IR-2025]
MWVKKMIFVFSFIFSLPYLQSRVLASDSLQGWGRVNMQGAIVDTACAIAVGSRDQTIDMEVLPVSDIIRDGQGRNKPFSIELVNCILERPHSKFSDWKQFQMTFDGDNRGELFGVRGEASGVALRITDESGNIATPGIPMRVQRLIPGNMQLNYHLRLVSNNHVLKAGEYFTAIRFKLDYF